MFAMTKGTGLNIIYGKYVPNKNDNLRLILSPRKSLLMGPSGPTAQKYSFLVIP